MNAHDSNSTSVSSEIYSTFLASLRSVGSACTLAAVGIYLHRRGYIIGDGKRTLALISQQVTIPLLFFTKIIYCNQDWSDDPCPDVTESLKDVWILLLWPAYVVAVGALVGYFSARLSRTPKAQRRAVLAACMFGNSTGLPITLLTVVHANFPSTSDLGRIDPCLFLSVYLLLYPVLQWGLGGWMLAPAVDTTTRTTTTTTTNDEQQSAEGILLISPPPPPLPVSLTIRQTSGGGGGGGFAHNVLNQPTTSKYQWKHRGLRETDASMYMSVQENLNIYGRTPSTLQQYPTTTILQQQQYAPPEPIGMDLSRENSLVSFSEHVVATSTPPTIDPAASDTNATTETNVTEQTALLLTDATVEITKKNGIIGPQYVYYQSKEPDDNEQDCWDTTRKILGRCLQPPVVGALAGMLVASFPSLRGIFVDLVDRSDDAPLEWMFDGLYSVGQAAVPINMIILGCNLSASWNTTSTNRKQGDDDDDDGMMFSQQTTWAVVLGKLLVMPMIGFVSAFLFRHYLWEMPDDIAGSFYLVIMIVFLTPTANNVMVMVELSGSGTKEAMARLIAWQYALAPLLLSLTMTAAVGIADQWS